MIYWIIYLIFNMFLSLRSIPNYFRGRNFLSTQIKLFSSVKDKKKEESKGSSGPSSTDRFHSVYLTELKRIEETSYFIIWLEISWLKLSTKLIRTRLQHMLTPIHIIVKNSLFTIQLSIWATSLMKLWDLSLFLLIMNHS